MKDIQRLTTAIVLIAALAMAVRVPASPDMWWHLRCGEVQWRTRTVLRSDVFSHTAYGTPWVNQSWLPQLAMYGLFAAGGFPLLAVAVAAAVTAAAAFVLAAASLSPDPSLCCERVRCNALKASASHHAFAGQAPSLPLRRAQGFGANATRSPGQASEGGQRLDAQWGRRYGYLWQAFVVLWAVIATGRVWAPRPHMVTFLLTAAWIYLLDRHRQGKKWALLCWLPPLMAVWANSHGGYVVGFLLLGAEAGGAILGGPGNRGAGSLSTGIWRRTGPLLAAALACALAALLNPQGARLLLFPFQTLGSAAQQGYVAEWASPDFHAADMIPFLGLLLATWSAPIWARKRLAGAEWLRLLGFTAMALRSQRHLGLCALAMAPLLVRYGAAAIGRLEALTWPGRGGGQPARGLPALNWALLILALAAAGFKASLPLRAETIAQVHQQLFPVQAVDYLDDHGASPTLFNEYNWGGYLIWRLYPDVPVFIDGRADPYGDALIAAYRQTILTQPGWEKVLDQYDVHTALIAAQGALAQAMEQSGGWKRVYADEMAVVFQK